MKHSVRKIVVSALFSAIVFVTTLLVQIPLPFNGYVNAGDGFILLSGFILGPVYGGLAAGIGSMLADIISGFAIYAPATFVIKLGIVLVSCGLFSWFNKLLKKDNIARVFSALAGEMFMVLGYFAYECIIFGSILAPLTSVLGNICQGVFGVILGVTLFSIFNKTNIFKFK